MAESIRFDFLSSGADRLARDFKNTGDNAALASRGAKVLQDVIERLGQKEGRTAAESRLLARALNETGVAEDRAAAKALRAEIAISRLDEELKKNERDALAAAAANRTLGDSFDKLAEKAGGPSLKGSLLALSPALIPATAGIAAGVGAIGVSFGAAAAGAGLFGALAKSVFSNVSKDNQKLQTAQKQLAAAQIARSQATTKAQRTAADNQIFAAQDTIKAIRSEGAAYNQVLDLSKEIGTRWKVTAAQIASPALVPWLTAVSKGIGFIRPLVQPVADQFRSWGQAVDRYFSSSAGSAEITRLASAFGRFSADQLSALGVFFTDVGKAVLNLGRDLAGHNVDFGAFSVYLDRWGGAFLRWSQSAAARQDVSKFLALIRTDGPAVGDLLKNLGGALAVFAPGLTSIGALELKLVSDFLGFLAKTPQSIAKPLTEVAGALLLLQKTGVLKVGIKIVGAAAKWLTGGAIDIGGGAAAAGEIRAAFASGGAAAAAEIRAALAGGGAAAGAEGAAGGAAAKGGIPVLAGGSGAFAAAGVAAAGVFAGAFIKGLGDKLSPQGSFAGNLNHNLQALGGPASTSLLHSFTFGGLESWVASKFGIPVGKAINNALDFLGGRTRAVTGQAARDMNTLASVFTRTGKAAAAARTDVGTYTAAIVQNGLNSDKARAARDKLVKDMTTAGISAGTARSDVSAYSLAIDVNGARSDQARAARQRLNADIEKAFRNSQQGRTDLAGFTGAVTRHSAQSDAVRGARQRLISDLVRAGVDSSTAKVDVNNLQTAINRMHGKGISISMSGKGYYTITEAGKNYQISAGGLFSPHAAGGFISGGIPGRDSVPGMLMPGEVVVPVSMVKAGAVDHLRGALPGFATGGAVGPVRTGEAGIGRFYRADVNDEGYSLVSAMRKALKSAEAATRAAAASAGAVGALGGPTSASAAQAQAYARSRLGAYGWSSGQMPPLIALWNQESGWNRFARNPSSGAYGIPQALPPGKMGAAANPPTSSAAAQINWGLSYIKGRYGSPAGAESHERAFNWYARGGLVPGYASGGSVSSQGAAYLRAWQTRHGGPAGAAHGPVVLNEQIARLAAAAGRAQALAGASGLSPGQHRFWAASAAGEKKRLGVLHSELAAERAWRTQLGLNELSLDREIRAAGNLPALAGPVRGWKAQLGRDKAKVTAISRMLGYSDAYLAAHKPRKPGPKVTPPGVPGSIPHTGAYTDSTADLIAQLFAASSSLSRVVTLDSGGWLMPGVQAVANKTGRPEQVIPPGRGDYGGGGTIVLENHGVIGSQAQLEDWLVRSVDNLKRKRRL